MTQFVTVKVHQQFAQAIVGGGEVDFDLSFLPGLHTVWDPENINI